jgi:hypothetical protein
MQEFIPLTTLLIAPLINILSPNFLPLDFENLPINAFPLFLYSLILLCFNNPNLRIVLPIMAIIHIYY